MQSLWLKLGSLLSLTLQGWLWSCTMQPVNMLPTESNKKDSGVEFTALLVVLFTFPRTQMALAGSTGMDAATQTSSSNALWGWAGCWKLPRTRFVVRTYATEALTLRLGFVEQAVLCFSCVTQQFTTGPCLTSCEIVPSGMGYNMLQHGVHPPPTKSSVSKHSVTSDRGENQRPWCLRRLRGLASEHRNLQTHWWRCLPQHACFEIWGTTTAWGTAARAAIAADTAEAAATTWTWLAAPSHPWRCGLSGHGSLDGRG